MSRGLDQDTAERLVSFVSVTEIISSRTSLTGISVITAPNPLD